ncbi:MULTISPECIES: N-acyl-D-amino-acid deacylase family protein [Thermomonosporaceae]|uniref:N-acyl-D-amino-acid deacylase family protein n=1 Tax=Thermomonosporaceae TaxID=2012 RepID=UPI00255B0633|nr:MULTISPECIES: amidohydrolase family protein [Thermomonosporaceae]MDL4770765.1 amidohydrolase family protein [Actinomadura xylanilytica]
MKYDVVVRGGRWFDGTGAPSAVRHVGIVAGKVGTVSSEPLDEDGCPRVIDASGQWVLPGLVDIHTHYDAEILAAPELSESLRHGVTTVLLGSCSLSTVHVTPEDAGDLFGRVEAIPRRHVIDMLSRRRSWSNAAEYAEALEELPLGPNVAAFIGHSDIRAAVMGLARATRHDVRPLPAELGRMVEMLREALDAGFVGMSAQRLLFDKLDGERCRSRTLPSTYAKSNEMRRLTRLLRARGRILQAAPDVGSPSDIGRFLLGSIGTVRKPLKTSLLSAADVKSNPAVIHLMPPAASAVNLLGGDFRWQHLPVPFEVYADGIDLVIFEELGAGAAALHLREQAERDELLRDPGYRQWFKRDYAKRFTPRVWHRDLNDAEIVACPDPSLVGKSFGQVAVERGDQHPVDAYLDLVLEHGTSIRWRTTISNHRPERLDKVAAHSGVQIGFSDAGAHLRNMAFYNVGLRFLRRVHDAEQAGRPFMALEHAVHRLTGELADWFALDAGRLRQGDRADLVVIDPARLDDSLDAYAEDPFEPFGNLSRMVNRNDHAVTAVLVAGQYAFGQGTAAGGLGQRRTGRFLRAGEARGRVDPATVA